MVRITNKKKMGMYDSVFIPCPNCGEYNEFQSKGGDCFLETFYLENCPQDVLSDVNRHSPCICECGTKYEVDIENKQTKCI